MFIKLSAVLLLCTVAIKAGLLPYAPNAYIAPYASSYNAHQIAHSVAYPVVSAPVALAPSHQRVAFASGFAAPNYKYAYGGHFAQPFAAQPFATHFAAPVAAPVAVPVQAPVPVAAVPSTHVTFGAPIHTHTYSVATGAVAFSGQKYFPNRFSYAVSNPLCH